MTLHMIIDVTPVPALSLGMPSMVLALDQDPSIAPQYAGLLFWVLAFAASLDEDETACLAAVV